MFGESPSALFTIDGVPSGLVRAGAPRVRAWHPAGDARKASKLPAFRPVRLHGVTARLTREVSAS